MILIHQNKEPSSLKQYRESKDDPNISYKNLPQKNKEELEELLLKAQFFLCAYCMKKINIQSNDEHRIEDRSDKIRIEHWHSQLWSKQNNDREDLNYSNMLGVCEGKIDGIRYCEGKPRGSDMLVINPKNENLMKQIKYTNNGTIYVYAPKQEEKDDFNNFKKNHKELINSTKAEQEKFDEIQKYNQIEKFFAIEYDLNETLNLNNEKLRELRTRLWSRTIREIENKNKPIPMPVLEDKKVEWEKPVNGKKRPFLGFIIFRLNRMIENYKTQHGLQK